jgi:photosystem II stability/assembly factor-like uncharacterized protein
MTAIGSRKQGCKGLLIILPLLFSLLCSGEISAQSFWVRQPAPVSNWLNTCSFPDSLYGWAAGEEGVIIRTTDGGNSWTRQDSPVNFFIHKIYFVNRLKGWAVANDVFGAGTAVLSTTNSGKSWSFYRYPDSAQYFYSITFADTLNGWMCGFNGTVVKTTNGGVSWFPAQRDSGAGASFPAYDLRFYNKAYGFACGGFYDIGGVIWKTTDSGMNWVSTQAGSEPFGDIFYFDSLNVIAAGGDYEFGANIARTTDGGVSWEYLPLNIFGIATAVSFRTPDEGWLALSFSGNLARSTNGGISWQMIPAPDSSGVYDIMFLNERHGWAAGKNGSVYKYNTSVNISPVQEEVPRQVTLLQNYPNPFNPTTKIKFEIPAGRPLKIQLKIYDTSGREIVTLADEYLREGIYEVVWNGESFPGGVYFCMLKTGEFRQTKKLMLIK